MTIAKVNGEGDLTQGRKFFGVVANIIVEPSPLVYQDNPWMLLGVIRPGKKSFE
jgi:hypothetical protein